jgi:hypothetical protein
MHETGWWPGRPHQFWDVDTGKPSRVRDWIVSNARDCPLEEGEPGFGDDRVRMVFAGPGEVTVEVVPRGVRGEARCAATIPIKRDPDAGPCFLR